MGGPVSDDGAVAREGDVLSSVHTEDAVALLAAALHLYRAVQDHVCIAGHVDDVPPLFGRCFVNLSVGQCLDSDRVLHVRVSQCHHVLECVLVGHLLEHAGADFRHVECTGDVCVAEYPVGLPLNACLVARQVTADNLSARGELECAARGYRQPFLLQVHHAFDDVARICLLHQVHGSRGAVDLYYVLGLNVLCMYPRCQDQYCQYCLFHFFMCYSTANLGKKLQTNSTRTIYY